MERYVSANAPARGRQRESDVSGACWPRPQGFVGSNAAWPPTPRLTARHRPAKAGYFVSSKAWTFGIDINNAAIAIVQIDARKSMAVPPMISTQYRSEEHTSEL